MNTCSSCNLMCIYSIRFVRGCSHIICSDCTTFFMWRNNLPPPYFFSKGTPFCPVCFTRAITVELDTFERTAGEEGIKRSTSDPGKEAKQEAKMPPRSDSESQPKQ